MKSTELAAVPLTMSTLEIAGLTGKRHDHVLRDADKLLAELGIGAPNFGASYLTEQNKTVRLLNLHKRECLILVSGYSVKMRARIIDRWLELEAALAAPQSDLAITGDTRAIIGGIVKSCTRVVVQEIVQETLASVIPQMIAGALAARGVAVRRGKTSGELWHEFGFPAMHGAAQWFGHCEFRFNPDGDSDLKPDRYSETKPDTDSDLKPVSGFKSESVSGFILEHASGFVLE